MGGGAYFEGREKFIIIVKIIKYTEYSIKNPKELPRRPQKDPGPIVQSSGGKYFSTKFYHFRASYFSTFRIFPATVLETVTSPGSYILHNPFNIYEEGTKNN